MLHRFIMFSSLISMIVIASAGMGDDDLHYLVDFEDGTTAASVGISNEELKGGGNITVVDNPFPDNCNMSRKVAKHSIPGNNSSSSRAELISQRLPTEGQEFWYKWSYYIPSNYFTTGWNIFSQWKTWPCSDGRDYGAEICYSGGIFNEVSGNSNNFKFKLRANPDCHSYEPLMVTDQWVNWKMKIYWTNNSDGYAKVYKNGSLVYSIYHIKTLMDNFPHDGSCDIYWAVGMYNRSSTPKTIYTDNFAIYAGDDDDGDLLDEEEYDCRN